MILSLAAETTDGAASAAFGFGDVLVTALTGIVIVFTVLLLISLFIATLPRVLEIVAQFLPEVTDDHAPVDPSFSLLPDEHMLAAIGYVLHTELQREVKSGDSG